MRRAVLISCLLHLLVFGLLLHGLYQKSKYRVQTGRSGTALVFQEETSRAITSPVVAPKASSHSPSPARVAVTPPPQAIPLLARKPLPHPTVAQIAAPPSPHPTALASSSPRPAHHQTLSSHATTAAGAQIAVQPDYLNNPAPEYPEAAQAAREQGTVMLLAEVEVDGRPASVTIEHTSGYQDLDAEAVRTVRHWRFRPATLGGIALTSRVEIPIRFHLAPAEGI